MVRSPTLTHPRRERGQVRRNFLQAKFVLMPIYAVQLQGVIVITCSSTCGSNYNEAQMVMFASPLPGIEYGLFH